MANTNDPTPPNFRTIRISAEIKKIWGPRWNEPEVSYVFADGKRKFKLRTEDASIYSTSPDF